LGIQEAVAAGAMPAEAAGGRHERILDAAERAFADSGFAGASMRLIANEADVAQALIHYHFSNKEKLFEAVVARRAGEINGARGLLLDDLMARSHQPELEEVIEALFRPTIEAGHAPSADNNFARLLVNFANSADERSKKLAERYYDPIALRYIDALQSASPGLDQKNAVWAYMFAIGVGMTMMARTGRSNRLSNGLCDDSDTEDLLATIVPFICAGIRALSPISTNNAYQP